MPPGSFWALRLPGKVLPMEAQAGKLRPLVVPFSKVGKSVISVCKKAEKD